jgi:ATP-dependent protease ClpP protease subunit
MLKKFLIAAMVALMLSFAPMAIMAEDSPASPVSVILTLPEEPQTHNHFLNQESAGQLSNVSFITTDKLYIQLYSGISVADFIRMNGDLIKVRDHSDIRDVTLILNSPGGSAFDGLSIADMINRAQKEWGFTVEVHASGIVASAAVPIFAVCKIRYASPGTLFMVHEAALWKWPGRETMSDIISQGELMKKLQKQYLSYLVENSTTSLKKWKAMEKSTTWFTVSQARKLGLIDRGPSHDNGYRPL